MAQKSCRVPRQSLIISNISKRNNIKTLLIGAAAFGVSEVLVVGQPKLDLGHLLALAFGVEDPAPLAVRRFDTLGACRAYVVSFGGSICGVEIMRDAHDVCAHPFRGDTALLLGNEGTGLSSTQRAMAQTHGSAHAPAALSRPSKATYMTRVTSRWTLR